MEVFSFILGIVNVFSYVKFFKRGIVFGVDVNNCCNCEGFILGIKCEVFFV